MSRVVPDKEADIEQTTFSKRPAVGDHVFILGKRFPSVQDPIVIFEAEITSQQENQFFAREVRGFGFFRFSEDHIDACVFSEMADATRAWATNVTEALA